MSIFEYPLFWLVVFIGWGWICFYFGTYYGELIYRKCRYYKLKVIRWKRLRKVWTNELELKGAPKGKYIKE